MYRHRPEKLYILTKSGRFSTLGHHETPSTFCFAIFPGPYEEFPEVFIFVLRYFFWILRFFILKYRLRRPIDSRFRLQICRSARFIIQVDRSGTMSPSSALRSRTMVAFALPTVLVVGPFNFVLYKICYAEYGEDYAFFVSQARRVSKNF